MQKIPLDKARPGMVLAKPVLKDNQRVLVAENTKLQENHILSLKKQGVDFIVVKGSPVKMEGGSYGISLEKRLERLDHLFRKYKEDGWMQKVKRFFELFFEYKIKQQQVMDDSE